MTSVEKASNVIGQFVGRDASAQDDNVKAIWKGRSRFNPSGPAVSSETLDNELTTALLPVTQLTDRGKIRALLTRAGKMQFTIGRSRLAPITALTLLAQLSGCATVDHSRSTEADRPVYQQESFNINSPNARDFAAEPSDVCEAAKQSLLS